jgi:hypothetical protein
MHVSVVRQILIAFRRIGTEAHWKAVLVGLGFSVVVGSI